MKFGGGSGNKTWERIELILFIIWIVGALVSYYIFGAR